MADEVPAPTEAPKNGSGVFNPQNVGKAVGALKDPGAALKQKAVDTITSNAPGSSVIKGLNSIRNGDIGGAFNSGAKTLLAGATGGASAVFDTIASAIGAPDSVTLIKYIVIVLAILIILVATTVAKGAANNPLGLATDFSGTISQATKDNLNVDICQFAGVNDAINQEAQQTAQRNHTDNTPVMEDCLKAKAAAATLQHN